MPISCKPVIYAFLLLACPAVLAQSSGNSDRVITWRTYDLGFERSARVQVFPSTDRRRSVAVVIDESAGGEEPSTAEARYVAEVIGREFGFDPVDASFVFRYTGQSFVETASDSGKELLLRVTFRRLASGNLGSPSWRVMSREELSRLTDRAL